MPVSVEISQNVGADIDPKLTKKATKTLQEPVRVLAPVSASIIVATLFY